MKTAPGPRNAKKIYTQQHIGLDRDVTRSRVLHREIQELLASVKKDFASRAEWECWCRRTSRVGAAARA
ncbi:MAG TPA: hypothetical protein VF272_03340, partial [Candidatus Saccharimonadia bacterium]